MKTLKSIARKAVFPILLFAHNLSFADTDLSGLGQVEKHFKDVINNKPLVWSIVGALILIAVWGGYKGSVKVCLTCIALAGIVIRFENVVDYVFKFFGGSA